MDILILGVQIVTIILILLEISNMATKQELAAEVTKLVSELDRIAALVTQLLQNQGIPAAELDAVLQALKDANVQAEGIKQ